MEGDSDLERRMAIYEGIDKMLRITDQECPQQGVPLVAQRVNPTVSERIRVRSPAPLGGLRIQRCCGGVGRELQVRLDS